MMRPPQVLFAALLAFTVCFAAISCQTSPPAAAAHVPAYMPTATIKELMLSVIDPSADVVWLSVNPNEVIPEFPPAPPK